MEKIETSAGKTFMISLKANPSTGYRWRPHFDSSVISLVERHYKSEEEKIGGGGFETFTFMAQKIGKSEIHMTLKRSWEKDYMKKEIIEILIK